LSRLHDLNIVRALQGIQRKWRRGLLSLADPQQSRGFLMSIVSKQAFTAAIAAAAFIAFASAPHAQEANKEKAAKAAVDGGDAKRAREIAQADMAEVQAGKLGASKASSAEVREFAQHMVDDHGKHLSELRSMAKTKGMQLPSQPAKKHQDALNKLQSASGAAFDKQFMTMMVKDHEEALKLVQGTAKNAKDPELKADAEKTAPKIQEHLEMARKIAASLK
jgi:putative membrane protein